jgi:tRNA modification GTPase
VSALTNAGFDDLRAAILRALEAGTERDRPEITNVRHIGLLERAAAALGRAATAAAGGGGRGRRQGGPASVAVGALSEEFVLADLQDARAVLEEITGRRTAEDVLTRIFERFCIGK